MADSTSERKAALDQIAERWNSERSERTLASTQRTLRRRKQRGRLLAYASVASLLSAAAFAAWRVGPGAQTLVAGSGPAAPSQSQTQTQRVDIEVAAASATSAAPQAQAMRLKDGSQIALLDASARVIVGEVSPTHAAVELSAGRARFDVVHRPERVFRVICGEVTVEVLGTSFELEREGARTRVAVVRGRVAVEWSDGRTELVAGEAGWFPKPQAEEDVADTAQEVATTAKHASAAPKPVTSESKNSWREPAERGDFKHAYALLAQTKHVHSDDVEELMLAADTARLSGHPEAAVPFLNRVVSQHAQDSRAPLAAFTLGGVFMQQLGRPREAETAYARARQLSLNSSLAQDALARQVEAAHRAGDAEHAAELAHEYLARYPSGRRVHAVRRFGGLEP